MGFSNNDDHASLGWLLALLALSAGAALGIGTAALLSRRGRAQPEDPDAPLFI